MMFITFTLLEVRYIRNQLSREFILLFLISLSYTHIYNLNIIYSNKELLYSSDPLYLFLFFIVFLFFFYMFLACWLLFYLGLFNVRHNYIYFIE